MADASQGGGAMAGLATTPDRAGELFADDPVVIAGYNGPKQTVIAGEAGAVDRVCERARAAGITANRINVSHAFHSPLVAARVRGDDGAAGRVRLRPAQPPGGVHRDR